MQELHYGRRSLILASPKTVTFLALILLLGFSLVCPDSATNVETQTNIVKSDSKLPLAFIENRGQLDSAVTYYIHGSSWNIFFTSNAIVTELVKRAGSAQIEDRRGMNSGLVASSQPVSAKQVVIRKKFLGANPSCTITTISIE